MEGESHHGVPKIWAGKNTDSCLTQLSVLLCREKASRS